MCCQQNSSLQKLVTYRSKFFKLYSACWPQSKNLNYFFGFTTLPSSSNKVLVPFEETANHKRKANKMIQIKIKVIMRIFLFVTIEYHHLLSIGMGRYSVIACLYVNINVTLFLFIVVKASYSGFYKKKEKK